MDEAQTEEQVQAQEQGDHLKVRSKAGHSPFSLVDFLSFLSLSFLSFFCFRSAIDEMKSLP